MPSGLSVAARKKPAYRRKRTYRRPVYRRRSTYRRAPIRRRRRVARRTTSRRSMAPKHLSPFCLAHVNPFLPQAYGARVPDSNTAASRAFFDVTTTSVWAVSGKSIALMAMPWMINGMVTTASGATSTDWTIPATYGGGSNASRLSSIQTQFRLARPVAHGVRLSSPVGPLNANGYIHLCLNPVSTGGTTWTMPLSIDQMKDMPGYKRLALSSLTTAPVIYSNRFLDQSAFDYAATDDAVTADTGVFNSAGNGWMSIVIALDGTYNTNATTNQLNVENLVHYEGITAAGSLFIGTDEPSPSSPALMNFVANYVGRSDPLKPDVGVGAGAISAGAQEQMAIKEMVGESNPTSSRSAGPQTRDAWERARSTARRIGNAMRDGYRVYQEARPYIAAAGDLAGLVAGADRPLLIG